MSQSHKASNLSLKIADIHDDLNAVYDLAHEAAEYHGTVDEMVDKPNGVAMIAESVMSSRKDVITFLLMDGETPVGLLTALRYQRPLYEGSEAVELLWWVTPDHRYGKGAFKLLDAYEEWGRQVGCKRISISSLAEFEKFDKIFRRLGYTKREEAFTKELN